MSFEQYTYHPLAAGVANIPSSKGALASISSWLALSLIRPGSSDGGQSGNGDSDELHIDSSVDDFKLFLFSKAVVGESKNENEVSDSGDSCILYRFYASHLGFTHLTRHKFSLSSYVYPVNHKNAIVRQASWRLLLTSIDAFCGHM